MLRVATHSGPFHADDVLAYALLRVFAREDLKLVRTRDSELLAKQDLVFDVGHEFDPSRGRFDHHQREYEGSRSSAGMVLDFLEAEGKVAPGLAGTLRENLVDYVDAVDTGARTPEEGVPCFSSVIGVLNELAETELMERLAGTEAASSVTLRDGFDVMYKRAADIAELVVWATAEGFAKSEAAKETVKAAMDKADAEGWRTLRFEKYVKWKPAYFALGGETHASEYVLFPAKESDWRLLTIPVELGSREDKRPLPESWAGLEGEALEAAAEVSGAVFCHKNRFIAGFSSKAAAIAALTRWDRL